MSSGSRWLSHVAAAIAGLLLFLTPAVALAGPAPSGRALQEEEESAHGCDHLVVPRRNQFQPQPDAAPPPVAQKRRQRAMTGRDSVDQRRLQGRPQIVRVWRPSPLLAEPEPLGI